jgi:hypothetical protein
MGANVFNVLLNRLSSIYKTTDAKLAQLALKAFQVINALDHQYKY